MLWETPQNQMKNLGRECGFPVQSPVTKSVNKVRPRNYVCEGVFFSPSKLITEELDTKLGLCITQKLTFQVLHEKV